jgi:branched-chain amino acid transport system permease protein
LGSDIQASAKLSNTPWFPYTVLVGLLVAFPLIDRNNYHLSVGIIIGIYCIINLGLNLLLGNTGQISLGQAAFCGIGAYTAANLTSRINWASWGLEGWSFLLGTAGGMAAAAILGFFLGFLAVRLRGHYLAMATLGFQIIISVVMLEWYALTGGPGGFQVSPVAALGPLKFNNEIRYFYLTWAVVVLALWATRNLCVSRIGRALYAIKEYEELAEVCGVSPTKFKLQIFTYAAVLASLAGSLYAHYVISIGPSSFAVEISLMLLVMVVVGGLGTVWGTLIGTIVLYSLPEFIRYMAKLEYFSPEVRRALADNNYHLLIFGLVLAVFVLFFPRGLVGLFSGRRG